MNKLTALAVKNAQPRDKSYKSADGRGLFLVVEKDGRKWWRMRYQFEGKERATSLGTFPITSLADARKKRDEILKQLSDGKDPQAEKKRLRDKSAPDGPTLAGMASEWLGKQGWESNYRDKVEGRLRNHILPILGSRALGTISPPELLEALQVIEKAGTIETARRCKQHVHRIYRYAIAKGAVTINPAEGLEEAMVAKPKPKHFAAVTDPDALGGVLRAMYGLELATPQVKGAIKLLPLLMLRPGELVSLEWSEWSRDKLYLELPAEKMKMREPHVVPLARQARAVLEELHPWSGGSKYIFPSSRSRDRHMTVEGLTAALRRLGFSGDMVTAHGFRATARTLLDEELKVRPDFIEHQLAHQVIDPNRRAYNRTRHLDERSKMMQDWADYLDSLRGVQANRNSMSNILSKMMKERSKGDSSDTA